MMLKKLIFLFLCMAIPCPISTNPFKRRPKRQSSSELAQDILKSACKNLAESQAALKKQLKKNPNDPRVQELKEAVTEAEDALRQASREAKSEADFTRIPPINDASAAAQPESESHSTVTPPEPHYAKTPAHVKEAPKIYERTPSEEEMRSICDSIEEPAMPAAPPPIPPRPAREAQQRRQTVSDLKRLFEAN